MAHKQVLFRSAAREKILRGATQLADAVRVTLGPRSKSVLIERKWGAPIVCNDGVTIAKEFDLKDPEENLGAQMLRQAAEKTGDVVGDGTSTVDHPGARDLRRRRAQRRGRRQRDRHQARPRPRRQDAPSRRCKALSRPVATRKEKAQVATISAHNDRRHRRARRRCHGKGRRRRRDHGRGIEDHRDRARRRRRHAVRPRVSVALLHHQSREDGGRARGCARPALRPQDQRAQGPDPAARAGRQIGTAAAGDRRGRRGRGAGHADRQSDSRRAEELRRQGAGLRRSPQGDAAGHRRADRRAGDRPRNSASSSSTSRSSSSAAPSASSSTRTTPRSSAAPATASGSTAGSSRSAARSRRPRATTTRRSCRSAWRSCPAALP